MQQLSAVYNSLKAMGEISESDFPALELISRRPSPQNSAMEKKFQYLLNSVVHTLTTELGIPRAQLKLEQKVFNTYNLDIRYKDFAFEVNGPFHYIHDPYWCTQDDFDARKAESMHDFNGEYLRESDPNGAY